MNSIPKSAQLVIAVAVLAVLGLVIHHQRAGADEAGWEALAVAVGKGADVESLQVAALDARDTSAEPWVAVQLATALYDQGGPAAFEQARVVARQALGRFPEHPAAPLLSKLLAALDSFGPAS